MLRLANTVNLSSSDSRGWQSVYSDERDNRRRRGFRRPLAMTHNGRVCHRLGPGGLGKKPWLRNSELSDELQPQRTRLVDDDAGTPDHFTRKRRVVRQIRMLVCQILTNKRHLIALPRDRDPRVQ